MVELFFVGKVGYGVATPGTSNKATRLSSLLIFLHVFKRFGGVTALNQAYFGDTANRFALDQSYWTHS